MRKLINLIALLIMASSVTWAQDKKSFTLEDLMPGGNNYYNLLPQICMVCNGGEMYASTPT